MGDADFDRARAGDDEPQGPRTALRDGRLIDVEITTGPQEFNGRPAIVSIVNDVTERNRLDRQLRAGAFRDPLTGRANRTLFSERVAHALARTRGTAPSSPSCSSTCDNFKDDQRQHGLHHRGRGAPGDAAARIQAITLRPGDTVARLGADEFAVLLEEVETPRRRHGGGGAPRRRVRHLRSTSRAAAW